MWQQRLVLFLIASLVAILPFRWSNGLPTSPDSAGLVCVVQQRLDRQLIFPSTHGFEFHYQPCWRYSVYPGNQLLTYGVAEIFGDHALLSMIVLSIIMFAACVLLLYELAYVITQQSWAGWCVALLALASLPLWRSLVLTPQNTYGYFFILLLAYCLARSWPRSWYKLAGIIVSLVGLTFFHVLSLAVAGVALALYTVITLRKHPVWLLLALGGLVAAASAIGAWHYNTWNPWELYQAVAQLTIPGRVHPWTDHIAVWGYIPTVLALSTLGLLLTRRVSMKGGLYPLLIGVVAIIGAHPELTGINLLPERLITFAWIPTTLFGGITLYTVATLLPRWAKLGYIGVISLAAFTQAGVYVGDIYQEVTTRYLPSSEFQAAMEWLQDHRTDQTFVVGVAGTKEREMAFSGLWYHGDSAWYPWYRFGKNIFTLNSSDAVYNAMVTQTDHPQHQALLDLHTIITAPQSDLASAALQQYGITHVILRKSSPVAELWNKNPKKKPVVYENNQYRIYAISHP